MARIGIVGGGIAGLAAAWQAVQHGDEPIVFEAEPRAGGKLRTSDVAGVAVDEGADAFLARVPDGVQLCRELGLDDQLVSPAIGRAQVFRRGRLRALPDGLVLGVPRELGPLARSGLLSPAGLIRAGLEPVLGHRRASRLALGAGADSIGAIVRARFGDEVADAVVDPLVGGISAGAIDQLSADAMAPQLAAVRDRRSVLLALARSPRPADGPVFFTLRSGIGHLANTLADRLGPAIRTSTPIDAIEPIDGGWNLVSGQTITSVDRVVIATPPHCAASALGSVAPEAAGLLASITSASVAMVTLVVSRSALDRTDSSGFLVPRGERRLVTACSWGTAKWPHWTGADDQFVLRASVGSVDDPSPLNLDDDVLVNAVLDDLHRTMGLTAAPNGVRVTRWPLAFPQYRPGHLDLVASIRRSLPEGMRIAGSAVDGVGIPACIRSGRAAALA